MAMVLPVSLHASKTTVTINGGEQHASSGNWDVGSLTLTIDGHTEAVSFGQFSTVQSVASGLAAKFSLDCHSPVQAHAVGAVITFTTKRLNVSFEQVSASAVWDTADFTQASFGIAQPQAPPTTLTPSLALSCTPNPIPAGGSVDCTASLPKGPTGTVNFAINVQPAWSTANVDGDGLAPASILSGLQPGGPYTVTASYSGDSHYNATTQQLPISVDSGPLPSTAVYSYTISSQPNGQGTSGYAANGNILFYNDSVNGQWGNPSNMTDQLQYDSLNRLTSANVTTGGITEYLCWSYDSFGNRTASSSSTSSLTGSTCPTSGQNPTTGANWTAPTYDAGNHINNWAGANYDNMGNLRADDKYFYQYDGDGKLCAVGTRITAGMTGYVYVYDADGNRVAKGTYALSTLPSPDPNDPSVPVLSCDPTQATFQPTNSYVLGPNGEQVTEMTGMGAQATWAHTNVYAGAMLLATYDPYGLHFHITDWLGTRRVQTDSSGQVEEFCTNWPFGDRQNCYSPTNAPVTADDATEHHFTGKERDTESGLNYFGARYYSSSTARMTSPDPSGLSFADIGNPQSLNLYSYVLNNPLNSVDPNGLEDTPCGGGSTQAASGAVDAFVDVDPCAGGGLLPTPNPPEIDPCQGADSGCEAGLSAQFISENADFFAYAALLRGQCSSALKTGGGNKAGLKNTMTAWPLIQSASMANGIAPGLLGAIGIRETNFSNVAEKDPGDGKPHLGRGYFQIDLGGNKGVTEAQAFNLKFSSNFAAHLLSSNMSYIAAHDPSFNQIQLFQATAATYNMGLFNRNTGKPNISGNPSTIDQGTANGNYGNNVVGLMSCLF